MMLIDNVRRWAAVLLISVATVACSQVQYRTDNNNPTEATLPFERTVDYHVTRDFYDDPPRCAVIRPLRGGAAVTERGRLIEQAAARQLSFRLDRVIGPDYRDRLARELAVDLESESGGRRFANATRCDAALEISTDGPETTFALVWAAAKLELSLRLIRVRDGRELWRGRHAASRSEGTLPISPVSIPIGAFSAGRFHGDTDVFPSMADDVTRRILVSLPDTRGAFRRGVARR